ncbi:diguanylate cyclase, partial [Pseudoalteromonas sp. S201]
MLRLFSLYLCILLTLLSFSTLAQSLNDEQIKKIGPAIWQQVNIKSPVSGEQIISAYQNKQSPLV